MSDHAFLAVPCYGGLCPRGEAGRANPAPRRGVDRCVLSGSLLANTFNRLWVACLNAGTYTHFAMMHSDVAAPAGWLDTLLDEMARAGADVLSCVVPIKGPQGLTSTGWGGGTPADIRRLTMREVFQLPVTFDTGDLPWAAPRDLLFVNTGLWACRLGPWADDFPGFTVRDALARLPDGRRHALTFPEDWGASRWWADHGLRVMATRAVPVVHHGEAGYANDHAWGEWEHDRHGEGDE